MLPLSRPRSARRPARVAARGFTLIELMVVVVIIAIVAALALPTMSQAQFDRRVFTDAAAVGEFVREARLRAVGRGAAQMVVIVANSANNSLTAQTFESVTNDATGTGVNTPVSSCNAPTVWPTVLWQQGGTIQSAGGTANFVDQMAMTGGNTMEGKGQIMARMVYPYKSTSSSWISDGTPIYMCFTPIGRSYISTSGAPANFGSMGDQLAVQFTRVAFPSGGPLSPDANYLVRTLMISPTGATRIVSH